MVIVVIDKIGVTINKFKEYTPIAGYLYCMKAALVAAQSVQERTRVLCRMKFLLIDLTIGCRLRLPENFFPDREVPPLVSGGILFDQVAARTAEVVDAVGQVLRDADLPVRGADPLWTWLLGLWEEGVDP
jgi:hypothetical protein